MNPVSRILPSRGFGCHLATTSPISTCKCRCPTAFALWACETNGDPLVLLSRGVPRYEQWEASGKSFGWCAMHGVRPRAMAAANDILDRIQGALSTCSMPWVKTAPSVARTSSILQALCLGFADSNLAVAVDPASAKSGFHLVAGYGPPICVRACVFFRSSSCVLPFDRTGVFPPPPPPLCPVSGTLQTPSQP